MAAPAFPNEGPEREIFIQALRDFSDACEMPELTPRCPFFEVTKEGPSCGEQCIDILSQYDLNEASPTTVIDLGLGIHFLGRQVKRPRRGPKPDSRPFDARQIVAQETDLPRDRQQITTLLFDLLSSLATSSDISTDPSERKYRISASKSELEKRGINADDIIRLGLGNQIALGIAFYSIMLPSLNAGQEEPLDIPSPDPRWVSLFNESQPLTLSDDARNAAALAEFAPRIRKWILTADMADIVDWKPPETLENLPSSPALADKVKGAEATWIVERFLLTYSSEWEETSLFLEWLFLHGKYMPHCQARLLAERPTEAHTIATEISDRVTTKWRRSGGSREASTIRIEEFSRIAIDNLVAGRPHVAIAIYSSFSQVSPENPDAHNNYGFCLIPDDPQTALRELEIAEELGYEPLSTNIANRVLALHLLNRSEEALQLANRFFESYSSPVERAWLWQIDDASGGLFLTEDTVNTSRYVGKLVDRIMMGGQLEG